ncbi:hypothetical protein JCM6882_000445 [Rhodosporidiobolus microsporus]
MDAPKAAERSPAACEAGRGGDCKFDDGLATKHAPLSAYELFKSLSWGDRLLAPLVLAAMILGVGLGNAISEEKLRRVFDAGAGGSASWEGVSIPLLVGLLVMIWPAMSKVQWEKMPLLFKSRNIYIHLGISLVLNWIVAPFIMAACAWIALPEASMDRERRGVLLVGVARCIAMVIIWTGIAQGDSDYCAILVVANSILQIVLFSPYAILFCDILGVRAGSDLGHLQLAYSHVAKAVGIYLGIPLAAGALTRLLTTLFLTPRRRAQFFSYFGLLGMVGLLYVIIVLFMNQGRAIINNIGTVFRICVPLLMYFTLVWTATFLSFWKFSRSRWGKAAGGYEKAVTQAFTAGSNNFELAIAVAVASFGNDAPEALAATLGPLIEVPVLLVLSYVALYLRGKMRWEPELKALPASSPAALEEGEGAAEAGSEAEKREEGEGWSRV